MPRGGNGGRGRGTERRATVANLDGAGARNTRQRSQANTSRNTGESTNSASRTITVATEVDRNGGV